MQKSIRNFLILGLIVACVPVFAAQKTQLKDLNIRLIEAIQFQCDFTPAKECLKQGANANTKIEFENPIFDLPVLTLAAQNGNLEICALLIEYGADVNAFSAHICCKACMNHPQFIKTLEKNPVNPETLTEYRSTPLLEAVIHGQEKIVALLLANGAKIHDLNLELLMAANKGYLNICKLLIAHGANVNSTNKHVTVLSTEYENIYLKTTNPKITSGSMYKASPLIEAASKGHIAICKLLIDHGANINELGTVIRHNGNKIFEVREVNAFQAATKHRHFKTCMFLLKTKIRKFFKRS